MENTQTEVLVVGAGPSGLAAALYLASRGRSVVITNKVLQRAGMRVASQIDE